MMIISWAIAIGGNIPAVADTTIMSHKRGKLGQCFTNISSNTTSTSTAGGWIFASQTFLPYGLIGAMYLAVLFRIMTAVRKDGQVQLRMEPNILGSRRQRRILAKRIALARVLVASFLWCCFCNMPTTLAVIAFPQPYANSTVASLWLRFCAILQFAVNPVRKLKLT